jgi:hypothetical protein|tara:strand:+ start:1078 stop:1941 length:864 start_codon:yes stop_codon:yes gene_type:complete
MSIKLNSANGSITISAEDGSGNADVTIARSGIGTVSSLSDLSITATATELNILDGVTATAAELNILDGVTATAAELNILDGVTATAAEINILDGVTATATELNLLDGVTATTVELNLLDGVTATTTEINYVDGVTSAIQTQLDAKAPSASPTFTTKATVDGTLDIEEVYEKVTTQTSTTGTITFDTTAQAVEFYTADQTANRTINFSNVNSNLAIGQSLTVAVLMTQGSTAYYLNAYQVDGSSVTPKWSGGTAPSSGNTSSIDVYSFTIVKTADATFTVLAAQTKYA